MGTSSPKNSSWILGKFREKATHKYKSAQSVAVTDIIPY